MNRLRRFRERLEWSQTQLAAAVGTSQQHVDRLEKADHIPYKWASRLAPALGVTVYDLLPRATVRVQGYVGAGAQVFPFEDLATGDGLREALCPPGMDPATTEAVQVIGESMYPSINPGTVLFYSRQRSGTASELVGKLCVVRVADGATYVKRLQRGSEPRLFTLVSTNAPPIENVKLEWAVAVGPTMPPEMVDAAA